MPYLLFLNAIYHLGERPLPQSAAAERESLDLAAQPKPYPAYAKQPAGYSSSSSVAEAQAAYARLQASGSLKGF